MRVHISCSDARRTARIVFVLGVLAGLYFRFPGAFGWGGALILAGGALAKIEVDLPCLRGDR